MFALSQKSTAHYIIKRQENGKCVASHSMRQCVSLANFSLTLWFGGVLVMILPCICFHTASNFLFLPRRQTKAFILPLFLLSLTLSLSVFYAIPTVWLVCSLRIWRKYPDNLSYCMNYTLSNKHTHTICSVDIYIKWFDGMKKGGCSPPTPKTHSVLAESKNHQFQSTWLLINNNNYNQIYNINLINKYNKTSHNRKSDETLILID